MAKIMLVEDDINLSEIYKARLDAEGYTIVSAGDGEEALALAVKERPDLIICDVMMPKISGFEMLDILRGTPGIQNTKVIMMTALSQSEDKARATALGADRYLVKSQVTLEDLVQTAKDVLIGTDSSTAASPSAPTAVTADTATPTVNSNPAPSTPTEATTPTSSATTTPNPYPVTTDSSVTASIPVVQPPSQNPSADSPAANQTAQPPEPVISMPEVSDTAASPAAVYDSSTSSAQTTAATAAPTVNQPQGQSSASEVTTMNQQIESFIGQNPTPQVPAAAPVPSPTQSVVSSDTTTPVKSNDGIDIPGKKVIQPINNPQADTDLELLLAKEQQKELEKAGAQPTVVDVTMPAVESSGYLNGSQMQPGQQNPNNNGNLSDPNNIAL